MQDQISEQQQQVGHDKTEILQEAEKQWQQKNYRDYLELLNRLDIDELDETFLRRHNIAQKMIKRPWMRLLHILFPSTYP